MTQHGDGTRRLDCGGVAGRFGATPQATGAISVSGGGWIGGGGGISGPSVAIGNGTNGVSTSGPFGAGGCSASAISYGIGIGGNGSYPLAPQPNPVKATFQVPPRAKTIRCEIEDGRVVATFYDENGDAVQRVIVEVG